MKIKIHSISGHRAIGVEGERIRVPINVQHPNPGDVFEAEASWVKKGEKPKAEPEAPAEEAEKAKGKGKDK